MPLEGNKLIDNIILIQKKTQLLPSHYHNGQLTLRCTAEVGQIYAESTEAPLWSSRKEPVPERGELFFYFGCFGP